MPNNPRLQIFEDVFRAFCNEFGDGHFLGINRHFHEYSGSVSYTTDILVPGPLFDLSVEVVAPRNDDTGEYDELEMWVSTHNVVQVRQRKDLQLHVTVDTGPSGGRTHRLDGAVNLETDEDFRQACDDLCREFVDKYLPLQTTDELVAEIQSAKQEVT